MAKQDINYGAAGNDHAGDPLRTAFSKAKANFDELYARAGVAYDLEASEDLDDGDPVNLHIVSAVVKMRKADAADTTKPADGFVPVGVANGYVGTFYGRGAINDGFAAATLTPGAPYYLAVGGGVTATLPTTTLQGQQYLGKALSDTELMFDPAPMIEAP